MKVKSYIAGAALGLVASSTMFAVLPAYSASEQPHYSSQQEANVDYANALYGTTVTTEQMQEQMAAAESAEVHLRRMQMTSNSSQVQMAKEALHNVESMLTGTMSQMSGVSPQDVESMHDSGMSWGKIGHEIGLRPDSRVDRSGMTAGNTGMMGQTGDMQQGKTQATAMQSDSMGAIDSVAPRGYTGTSGGLSPFAHDSESAVAMSGETGRMSTGTDTYSNGPRAMQGIGISGQEMDAATARNMVHGGVTGHGTNVNSGLDHQSGTMMGGVGGLDNGMPAGHGARGGEGGMGGSDGMGGPSSGGMGGNSGGMGGSGGGSGGSGGGGGGGMM